MANVPATSTYLSDLFNPQVVQDYINDNLVDNMVFAPLADVDYTLVGKPGDTLTMPYFNYIGAANDLPEGNELVLEKLTSDDKRVTVKKIAKGIEITDEATLSGYGDTVGEIEKQIVLALADKVDMDFLRVLNGNTDNTYTLSGGLDPDGIADALVNFGENIEGRKVFLTTPEGYAVLRKANGWIPNTEVAANAIIRGTVGMIHGAEVVVSNRLRPADPSSDPTFYHIVKPGALRLIMKRNALVETARDITTFSTAITASEHYAAYLYNANKAIKIIQNP